MNPRPPPFPQPFAVPGSLHPAPGPTGTGNSAPYFTANPASPPNHPSQSEFARCPRYLARCTRLTSTALQCLDLAHLRSRNPSNTCPHTNLGPCLLVIPRRFLCLLCPPQMRLWSPRSRHHTRYCEQLPCPCQVNLLTLGEQLTKICPPDPLHARFHTQEC
jgi:hypothetical protein